MKIQNEFHIPLPPSEAWKVLNDVPRVATCVPGAKLVEENPDGSYVGTVAVRLGPIALSFKGRFVYKDVDESNYRVQAEANGTEQKARGTARAEVEFQLTPDGDGTKVRVDTDVQLAGSIAQYARGGSLIQTTAQVLMDQFAKNLEAELQGAPGEVPATSEQPAPITATQAAQSPTDAPPPGSEASAFPPEPVEPRRTPSSSGTNEISAFSLMLHTARYTVRRWFRKLSQRKG